MLASELQIYNERAKSDLDQVKLSLLLLNIFEGGWRWREINKEEKHEEARFIVVCSIYTQVGGRIVGGNSRQWTPQP